MENDQEEMILKIQRIWRGRRCRRQCFAMWTRLYRSMLGNVVGKIDASCQENRVEKGAYDLAVDHLSKHQDLIYGGVWQTISEFAKIHECLKYVIERVGHVDICDALYFYTNDVVQIAPYLEQIEYLQFFWRSVRVELEDEEDENEEMDIEFSPMYFGGRNLMLQLYGGKLHIPLHNEKKSICLHGYFELDHTNLFHTHHAFAEKYGELRTLIDGVTATEEFKENFLASLSFKDFILNRNEHLVTMCVEDFGKLVQFKQNTIAQKVKEFVMSLPAEQFHIIRRLFMDTKPDKSCLVATMLLDLVTMHEENPVIPCVGESIIECLHSRLRFKYQLRKPALVVAKENKEVEVPYKTRIEMMNANESIKSKAYAKLKEHEASRGDGNAKTQQYLDGLLSVPFGVYQEEGIKRVVEQYIADVNAINLKLRPALEKAGSFDVSGFFEWVNQPISEMSRFSQYCRCVDGWLAARKAETFAISAEDISKLKMVELRSVCRLLNQSPTGAKQLLVERIVLLTGSLSLDQFEAIQNLVSSDMGVPTEVLTLLREVSRKWSEYFERQQDYFAGVKSTLDSCVYGMEPAKRQITRLMAQWVHGKNEGSVFGFEGPPGTGKTTLAKHGISKCLKDENGKPRPFVFIPLGGSSDGTTLEGHHYTYVGSTWGRIVDGIINAKCMNPIIYIDELDKVSTTERGKEIIGILTHLTDPSQNTEFTDRYFSGVYFDLSKCLFIFSYNDASKVDPILLDRIQKITIDPLSTDDKHMVCANHIVPEILEQLGYSPGDIWMEREVLEHIVETYTCEAGARKLKEKLYELFREVNMRHLQSVEVSIPFEVTKDFVDTVFKDYPKRTNDFIHEVPKVGMVNGLFATAAGYGGITLIEACKFPTQSHLELKLTGLQGDVMKESMNVAKTLALNLIPKETLHSILQAGELDKFGIHVHCPAGAVPKDGPSAGTAITIAMVSLLCGIPVRNDFGITGEINLQGEVMPIGGLKSKVAGAKQAHVKHVLCPKKNEDDYEKIAPDYAEDAEFELTMIESVYQALEYFLVMPEGVAVRDYFRAV